MKADELEGALRIIYDRLLEAEQAMITANNKGEDWRTAAPGLVPVARAISIAQKALGSCRSE